MNPTIRKLYTFRKKQKSFDKTYGAKYVQDLLANIVAQKIEFSTSNERCRTEEDFDLDDLIINEVTKTEEIDEIQPIKSNIDQVDDFQEQQDVISPKKKIITNDNVNYGLIYRLKKQKQQNVVVPCKVSLRTFKMTEQDLDFMNSFDSLQLTYQSPKEIDFLSPLNDFYQRINEIVLNQL